MCELKSLIYIQVISKSVQVASTVVKTKDGSTIHYASIFDKKYSKLVWYSSKSEVHGLHIQNVPHCTAILSQYSSSKLVERVDCLVA